MPIQEKQRFSRAFPAAFRIPLIPLEKSEIKLASLHLLGTKRIGANLTPRFAGSPPFVKGGRGDFEVTH